MDVSAPPNDRSGIVDDAVARLAADKTLRGPPKVSKFDELVMMVSAVLWVGEGPRCSP